MLIFPETILTTMYFPLPLNLKPNVKRINRGIRDMTSDSYQSAKGYQINHKQHSITSIYCANELHTIKLIFC